MMSKSERETMEKLQASLTESQAKNIAMSTAHATKVDEMTKEIAQQKSYVDMYRNSSTKVENEIEAAHSLLDGLPQSPPRQQEGKESYGGAKDLPLTTRLASWIARVAFCEAFAKMGIK